FPLLELFFFSSRRRHTRFSRDWSSDVCSSDLTAALNDNAFQLICPLSDFQKLEGVYQLRIHFLGANGTRKTESFVFSFENDEPRSEERRVGEEGTYLWWPMR